MSERTLIVSDVHGMYDELCRVLDAVSYSGSDRLVFVGDYIDRGTQSRKILDFMVQLSDYPQNVFLRGNHEQMVLRLLEGETDFWYSWLEYGVARPCLQSYRFDPAKVHPYGYHFALFLDEAIVPLNDKDNAVQFLSGLFPDEHIRFLKETTLRFETDEYFVSHGGLEPGLPLEDQGVYSDSFLIWGDGDFLKEERDYGKIIVYGHFHFPDPNIGRRKVGIALQNAVSVLDLNDMTITDSRGRKTVCSSVRL
jgi:serine/threonine protein phosphatase 1